MDAPTSLITVLTKLGGEGTSLIPVLTKLGGEGMRERRGSIKAHGDADETTSAR